jgi:UDP-N-acetyl-D-glucosamine dehydrogenase
LVRPMVDVLQKLEEKINDRSARVGIIGLGYVGLPLSVAFSQAGFNTLGIDIQQKRVDLINRGQSYVADVSSKSLKAEVGANRLQATTDQSKLAEQDGICICVPTPLTKTKDPDLSYVTREAEEVAKYLRRGQIVVLESTTYPGTTRQVVLPILESSGLKCGVDFYLAYSPERVDPGNKRYRIKNTPKLVGGITKECTRLSKILYSKITDSVVPVSCPEVAEMTKIFENVFRSVNIALVNEMAQLCHNMSVSAWEVIEAASTKPFGYMPFYPGPGVGGHCIPLDPYYLSNKAREFDFHTRFIELAAETNEHMPYYTVFRILEALNEAGKPLNKAKIFVLGVTYKKDTEDIRESPSLKVIQLLREKGADISYNDPYIKTVELANVSLLSRELTEANLAEADCVIIATDHSCYNIHEIIAHSKSIFDSRGVTSGINNNKIIRLGE